MDSVNIFTTYCPLCLAHQNHVVVTHTGLLEVIKETATQLYSSWIFAVTISMLSHFLFVCIQMNSNFFLTCNYFKIASNQIMTVFDFESRSVQLPLKFSCFSVAIQYTVFFQPLQTLFFQTCFDYWFLSMTADNCLYYVGALCLWTVINVPQTALSWWGQYLFYSLKSYVCYRYQSEKCVGFLFQNKYVQTNLSFFMNIFYFVLYLFKKEYKTKHWQKLSVFCLAPDISLVSNRLQKY